MGGRKEKLPKVAESGTGLVSAIRQMCGTSFNVKLVDNYTQKVYRRHPKEKLARKGNLQERETYKKKTYAQALPPFCTLLGRKLYD